MADWDVRSPGPKSLDWSGGPDKVLVRSTWPFWAAIGGDLGRVWQGGKRGFSQPALSLSPSFPLPPPLPLSSFLPICKVLAKVKLENSPSPFERARADLLGGGRTALG